MYYIALVAALAIAACSNEYSYPVQIMQSADGSDSGSTADGGQTDVSLMGFGHHDGGTEGVDAAADVGDAGAEMADATAALTDAAVQLDAVVPPTRDATTPTLGTTCVACKADADCDNGYSCLYRPADGGKRCLPRWAMGTPTPPDCLGGSGKALSTYANSSDPGYFFCAPTSGSRTCDSWLAEFGS